MAIVIGNTVTFRARFLLNSVVQDISGATTKEIKFRRPDGSYFNRTASFTTDGTDGMIEYDTVSTDLSLPGIWKWAPHVITPSDDWWGDPLSFSVKKGV